MQATRVCTREKVYPGPNTVANTWLITQSPKTEFQPPVNVSIFIGNSIYFIAACGLTCLPFPRTYHSNNSISEPACGLSREDSGLGYWSSPLNSAQIDIKYPLKGEGKQKGKTNKNEIPKQE